MYSQCLFNISQYHGSSGFLHLSLASKLEVFAISNFRMSFFASFFQNIAQHSVKIFHTNVQHTVNIFPYNRSTFRQHSSIQSFNIFSTFIQILVVPISPNRSILPRAPLHIHLTRHLRPTVLVVFRDSRRSAEEGRTPPLSRSDRVTRGW